VRRDDDVAQLAFEGAMTAITVHDGDYRSGSASFYPSRLHGGGLGFGFVVRTRHNQTHRIPLEDISAVEYATPDAIRMLGGGDRMVDTFERLSVEERNGAFVALFADGTMLLGSTDVETCWRICVGRSLRRGGEE
jgi:hypothetical protein